MQSQSNGIANTTDDEKEKIEELKKQINELNVSISKIEAGIIVIDKQLVNVKIRMYKKSNIKMYKNVHF